MNIALRIKKELGDQIDLRLIKKVVSIYEVIKNEDDLVSFEDTQSFLHESLGEIKVSEKIKAFRDREGLSQRELAKKSNLKQQHISEIERDIRPVGVGTAKKLANALNCDYRSLL